jgi:hypothetical protein
LRENIILRATRRSAHVRINDELVNRKFPPTL